MAFREVRVHEVREVLRHWLGSGLGLRPIAERAGVNRKTARRYIDAAVELGVVRECGLEQLSDELIGAVINAVRPERSQGHGAAWDRLLPVEEEIRGWVKDGLQLINIHGKLERRGVAVPYRTLHRFAVERCGFGRRGATLRVADGAAGMECQVELRKYMRRRGGNRTDRVGGRGGPIPRGHVRRGRSWLSLCQSGSTVTEQTDGDRPVRLPVRPADGRFDLSSIRRAVSKA